MYRIKQLILLGGDSLILYLALYGAIFARTGLIPDQNFTELLRPMTGLFLLAFVLIFIIGGYDLGGAKKVNFYQRMLTIAILWTSLGAGFFYIFPTASSATPKTILVLTALLSFSALTLWHWLYNRFLAKHILIRRVAFAGNSPEVQEMTAALRNQPELGYEVAGVVTDSSSVNGASVSLENLIGQGRLDIIVLAGPQENPAALAELYQQLFKQTSIITAADLYEQLFGRVPPMIFSDAWFITHLREQEKRVYDRVRILADYATALIMGLFFIITFPFIASAIKLNSAGPIFFRQTRVGRLGRIFTVIKYRTMRVLASDGSAEVSGPKFADVNDPRITMIGRFLRQTRLDEIPQCWNIMQGHMAFIGPRPERPEFVATLTAAMPYYRLRLLVKPGLTGWAQIHQSYFGTIAENLRKLEYDIFYIKNRGALLDLGILLRTFLIVGSLGGR